jgi:hypothetical protein
MPTQEQINEALLHFSPGTVHFCPEKGEFRDEITASLKYGEVLVEALGARMDEVRAREILGEHIQLDGTLTGIYDWMDWPYQHNIESAYLDGDYSADELEAIAWWMRNKGADQPRP